MATSACGVFDTTHSAILTKTALFYNIKIGIGAFFPPHVPKRMPLEIKNDPDASAIAVALNMARAVDKVIVTTTDADFYAGQVKLVTDF